MIAIGFFQFLFDDFVGKGLYKKNLIYQTSLMYDSIPLTTFHNETNQPLTTLNYNETNQPLTTFYDEINLLILCFCWYLMDCTKKSYLSD